MRSWLRACTVLLATACLAGCLDGDPNPTTENGAASSSGTSGLPAPAGTVQPGTTCSKTSTEPANLPFRNGFSDRSAQLFWVDYGCKEVAYAVLKPGESHVQQTFVTHVWRIRDAQNHALYKEYTPMSTAPPEVVVP